MQFKMTLTITCAIGFVFSIGMFLFPEFVTREQFSLSEGQGFEDLVTLRYAIASLILALAVITFHLREVEGTLFQLNIMRGYWIAFSIVCATNIVLQLLGKISAVPPTIALALIALLTFFTWRSLFKVREEESD
jgi:hypothetical protein